MNKEDTVSEVRRQIKTYKFRNLVTEHEQEGELVAYWEIASDPISDDYTPSEITAHQLLEKWVKIVTEKYPAGLVPIFWSVQCKGQGVFESMPFQFDHFPGSPMKDFIDIYTWPLDTETDEPLNWLTLPVVDKLWNPKHADKGGFIQEATSWKPSILQPYVYPPTLTSIIR
jgi:hypothetical protein